MALASTAAAVAGLRMDAGEGPTCVDWPVGADGLMSFS